MNIWNMTKKDLQVFFKDRGALAYLFLMPLVFMLIFAFLGSMAWGGSSSQAQKDDRAVLPVVNLDADGALAKQFIASFNQSGAYRAEEYDLPKAQQLLNQLKLLRYLVIPEHFSADLAQGRTVALDLIVHPDADSSTTQAILQVVQGVANGASLEQQILDGIRQMGAMQASNPQAGVAFNTERILTQAKQQFNESRQDPLVAVVQREPLTEKVGEQQTFDLGTSIVPGVCVLFVFLAASTVAHNIYDERRSGSLRRLLAAPMTRTALLLGKLVPILVLTLIQIGFIFLIGSTLLPLLGVGRLGIGRNPLAWAAASACIAVCSTSMGILIAGITRTEGQITGLSNALLWVAGFLGGGIVPTYLFKQVTVLYSFAHLLPQFYATTAYYDIITRGKGLAEVWTGLLILLAFSAVFFLIGARRFKFE